ncbi:hypothetical protein MNBD_ALPHA11-2023 [hydrothermal vent metagenome]|uniref:Plasmid pRiA4b Orf3-like domain-containing protein n=1 Tax=hydrothermal vent metagenome TaxID=652676 RepID=A0A3B0U883_9ZZZZ
MSEAPQILQLKIRLLGISPMIWRRVLVPSTTTLRELHGVLQVAMGWEGIHLFQFDIHAVDYGSWELHAANPDIPLQDFGFCRNDRFSYIYDMGDYWKHDIRVEVFPDNTPKKAYPICTGGSGLCPPEDCGGPDGFLARRDEADGYDAWQDMGMMADWLSDVMQIDTADKTVGELLPEDVEAAMERVVARGPYVRGKFSRKQVNDGFRDELHLRLQHQQIM